MPIFWDKRYRRVTDIAPVSLIDDGISLILLDVDNTLTTHDNPVPAEGVRGWLHDLDSAKIDAVIVSNNSEERVSPFAQLLGLPFIPNAKKPLPFVVRRLIKSRGLKPCNVAVIGDQLFTDMLFGRLLEAKCLLTEPIEPERGRLLRIKRVLERPIRGQIWQNK